MTHDTNQKPPAGCLGLLVLVAALCVFTWIGTGGCSPSTPAARNRPREASAEDLRKQPERQAFIDDLVVRGIILKTEKPGQVPRVFVGRPFYLLTFDQKQSFLGVVLAYHKTADPTVGHLILRDGYDGKEIGTLDATRGLRLK